MKKTITIGITGHRDIIETKKLKQEITDFFENLKKQNQETKLLSPLADGADRLVADIYLEVFKEDATLIVPMPFNQERYLEDFDTESQKDFLNYLEWADSCFEVVNSHSDNYRSVGVYVVEHLDILLALWDGVFNHKVGGTGDIVQYAQNQNKKVIHLRCDRGLR